MRFGRITTVGGVTILVLLAMVGVGYSSNAQESSIRACVELAGSPLTRGDLKLRTGNRCPKGTRPISWSLRGPRGLAGASGHCRPACTGGTTGTSRRKGRYRRCWAEGRHGRCWAGGCRGGHRRTGWSCGRQVRIVRSHRPRGPAGPGWASRSPGTTGPSGTFGLRSSPPRRRLHSGECGQQHNVHCDCDVSGWQGGAGRWRPVTVNLATQLGRAAIKESFPSGPEQWTAVGVITSTLVGSIASVTAWAVCAA